MDRPRLLQRLGEAWEELKASYADIAEAEMAEPGVAGSWSIKDIIAHVATWEEESLKHLPLILGGVRPPRYSVTYGGIDAFNAQSLERSRELPLSVVLCRRDDTHRRLLRFLAAVPDEQFATETRFRRRLRLDTYGHYRKHARAIRNWRERRAG